MKDFRYPICMKKVEFEMDVIHLSGQSHNTVGCFSDSELVHAVLCAL